jgi:ornithine cyclodeaminase/alanine dehydrogenase-like protein (mu-crystallin family)
LHKRELPVLVLNEAEVKTLLDPLQLLDALADGFRELSQGLIQSPDRPEITVPNKGFSVAMPAWKAGMNIAVKVVNNFDRYIDINLPSHLATINLFDPKTGAPVCIMDGTYITAIRTAGSAVLSVRELARKESRTATIIGVSGSSGPSAPSLAPIGPPVRRDPYRVTCI